MSKQLEPKGAMRLTAVDFMFGDSRDESAVVVIRFIYDENGNADSVVALVKVGEEFHDQATIDNRNARYKPCATHAAEILRTLIHKPPKTAWAKQRLQELKPALKVVG